ncbi:MAG: ABC transporter ATP-binding protein [Anaerolineales bacterium]
MNNAKPVLRVQKLGASFTDRNGVLHVLEDVSFDVPKGQFVCIVGPSGSGKSTLLRVLAGLLNPVSGLVEAAGSQVSGPQPNLGIVFQDANLMGWRTVRENIGLPIELKNLSNGAGARQIDSMIELIGLQGFEETLPADLSGGMAQRVAIARALVSDPDILLMDEPFGSLDAITREWMGDELLSIWDRQHKTIVMVTHDISEAVYLADRVLVLSPRPARIRLDLQINLPRPRKAELRYTKAFGELASKIREAIS